MPTTYILRPDQLRSDHGSARQASLRTNLERLGLHLVGEGDDPAAAVNLVRLLQPTCVIVEVAGELGPALEAVATLHRQRLAPVVLLSDLTDPALDREAALAGAMAHLPLSCSLEVLSATFEVALARWRELTEVERKLTKVEQKLKDRIVIERAKGILMKNRPGLTEDAAYARLRTLSMTSRTPLARIAEAILLASELADDQELETKRLTAHEVCPLSSKPADRDREP